MCNSKSCAYINIDPLFMHNGISSAGRTRPLGLAYSKNMRSEYFFFAKKKVNGGKTMII